MQGRSGDLICLVMNNTKARCIFKSLSHAKLIFSELELACVTSNCSTRHGSRGACAYRYFILLELRHCKIRLSLQDLVAWFRLLGFKS